MPAVPERSRNMRDYTVTIKVEFPALDHLVVYLETRGEDQKQIDALAATVREWTAKLHQSSTGLGNAVDTNQGKTP